MPEFLIDSRERIHLFRDGEIICGLKSGNLPWIYTEELPIKADFCRTCTTKPSKDRVEEIYKSKSSRINVDNLISKSKYKTTPTHPCTSSQQDKLRELGVNEITLFKMNQLSAGHLIQQLLIAKDEEVNGSMYYYGLDILNIGEQYIISDNIAIGLFKLSGTIEGQFFILTKKPSLKFLIRTKKEEIKKEVCDEKNRKSEEIVTKIQKEGCVGFEESDWK